MNEKQKDNWISVTEMKDIYESFLVKNKSMLSNKVFLMNQK